MWIERTFNSMARELTLDLGIKLFVKVQFAKRLCTQGRDTAFVTNPAAQRYLLRSKQNYREYPGVLIASIPPHLAVGQEDQVDWDEAQRWLKAQKKALEAQVAAMPEAAAPDVEEVVETDDPESTEPVEAVEAVEPVEETDSEQGPPEAITEPSEELAEIDQRAAKILEAVREVVDEDGKAHLNKVRASLEMDDITPSERDEALRAIAGE